MNYACTKLVKEPKRKSILVTIYLSWRGRTEVVQKLPGNVTVHSHCVLTCLKVSYSDVGEGGAAVNFEKTQFFLKTLYNKVFLWAIGTLRAIFITDEWFYNRRMVS